MLSAGIWIGVPNWRPATWWIAAACAFVLAAMWYLQRRPWAAKGLALGTWCLLGALLVQFRPAAKSDPRVLAFADGRELTITAHVIREGYQRADARSVRQQIDVETENVELEGQTVPISTGVRLKIYEGLAAAEWMESRERVPEPGGARI